MDDAKAFGKRLREVRSWRELNLREAGGLRVHPTELTEQPWTQQDARHADAPTGLEGIEIALERYELGVDPEVPVRAWPEIAADLERLEKLMHWSADYAAQRELTPTLLGELHSTTRGCLTGGGRFCWA